MLLKLGKRIGQASIADSKYYWSVDEWNNFICAPNPKDKNPHEMPTKKSIVNLGPTEYCIISQETFNTIRNFFLLPNQDGRIEDLPLPPVPDVSKVTVKRWEDDIGAIVANFTVKTTRKRAANKKTS